MTLAEQRKINDLLATALVKHPSDFEKELPVGREKEFTVIDHSNGERYIPFQFQEYRPCQLHYKPDGAVGDKPSFAIVMENKTKDKILGQISLEMLKRALNEIGYTLYKS